jgi:predicted lipoprotein with Yx(FWY)xxD motif
MSSLTGRAADDRADECHGQWRGTVACRPWRAASRYGSALTDHRGFALYRFTHDADAASTCYGACADAWPPYLVPRKPAPGSPDGGLVGTMRRTDGRLQVTYAGHPLYYYVGDRQPGSTAGQGLNQFGALWYVLAPSGNAVTSAPPTTSPAAEGTGGGYGSGY